LGISHSTCPKSINADRRCILGSQYISHCRFQHILIRNLSGTHQWNHLKKSKVDLVGFIFQLWQLVELRLIASPQKPILLISSFGQYQIRSRVCGWSVAKGRRKQLWRLWSVY
jgi:hypothetical protein